MEPEILDMALEMNMNTIKQMKFRKPYPVLWKERVSYIYY